MMLRWLRAATQNIAVLAMIFGLAVVAIAQDEGEGAADAAETTPVSSEVESADLGRELRSVEEEVNRLKERVFRSKATLQLLKELVTEGSTVGARLNIWHVNQLGGGYSMESVQYFVDGRNIFGKVDPSGTLDTMRELKVFEQAIPPGEHNLRVQMVLRGKGYKIFSYLRDYQFRVQSNYSFSIEDGKLTLIRVVANTRGGLRNFAERPDIRFEPRVESLRE
jgi:hypothetical protein